eukprot:gene6720-8330_t
MSFLEKEATYDDILHELSIEQPPSGGNPATYKMKSEYWKYFNSYYPLFSLYALEDSTISYLEYKKAQKLPYPESLPLPPVGFAPIDINDSDKINISFLSMIDSDYLHHMILSILKNYIINKDVNNEIGCGVNESLYFLVMAIRDTKPCVVGWEVPWTLLQVPKNAHARHNNAILCILQKYKFPDGIVKNTLEVLLDFWLKSNQENLYLDKKEFIVKSLEGLANYHKEIEEEIYSLCPSFKRVKSGDDQGEAGSKAMDAKKRQAEIMAKFAQQQSKFLQTIHTSIEDDEEDYEDDDDEMYLNKFNQINNNIKSPTSNAANTNNTNNQSTPTTTTTSTPKKKTVVEQPTCVLCLKGQLSKKDPLCMISFLQASSLLTFSKLPHLSASHVKPLIKSKYLNFPSPHKSTFDTINHSSSFHIRCCGHHIHHQCYENYFSIVLKRSSTEENFEGNNVIRPVAKEFLCPMCRRVSNIIIPSLNDNQQQQQQQQQPQPQLLQVNNNNLNTTPVSSPISAMNETNFAEKRYYEHWISSIKNRNASSSSSSSSSSPQVVDIKDNLFFYSSLSTLVKLLIGESDPLITPYFLYQILSKNIEFLEIESRPISNENGNNNSNLTSTTNNINNNNNNNNTKQFPVSNEIFARDILTITTFYRNIKDSITSPFISGTSKFRSNLVDLLKGKSDSILSLDPFSLFTLFTAITDRLLDTDIEIITNLTLDIYVIQFFLTLMYSDNEVYNNDTYSSRKKQSLYQSFLQYTSDPSKFSDRLENRIPVFLRCMYIAYHCILSKVDSINREDLANLPLIMNTLKIKNWNNGSISDLMNRALKNPLIQQWMTQLESNPPFFILENSRPVFLDLPNTYQEIFNRNAKVVCKNCNTIPENAAICMFCHTLVCLKGTCCQTGSVYESFKHTLKCGIYRVGLFLETKGPRISVIRDYRKSLVTNCYLDIYGESDAGMDRGKTLTKNNQNLQDLWNAWISHSLEEKFLSHSTLTGRNY